RGEPGRLGGVRQAVVERVEVDRETALREQVVERVLVRRNGAGRIHPETPREAEHEPLAQLEGRRCRGRGRRWQAPERFPVTAPVERVYPARQRLARIPLALAVGDEAVGREALAQALDERRP